MKKEYNFHYVVSNEVVECWYNLTGAIAYDDGLGIKELTREQIIRKKFDDVDILQQAFRLKRKSVYYRNKRFDVMRLVNVNYDDSSVFLTLTFKENILNVGYANNEFTKFIKRLKRYLRKFDESVKLQYIATWERQKRGAVHYHIILFNFPYIKNDTIARIWQHGFIKINKINDKIKQTHRVGLYISKYFTKDLEFKEHKKKAFFTSRNLKKPLIDKIKLDNTKNNNLLVIDNLVDYIIDFKKSKCIGVNEDGKPIFDKDKYVYFVTDLKRFNDIMVGLS